MNEPNDAEQYADYIAAIEGAAQKAASRVSEMIEDVNAASKIINGLKQNADILSHDLRAITSSAEHIANVLTAVERWYVNERKVNPDNDERESALEDVFHAVHEWTGDQLDG